MSRFSEQADLYHRYRPDYPSRMYDFIFQHLNATEYAWDCATGSGQIAGYLADHFNMVYATDISSEQLKRAPRKDNIRYRQTAAEDSGLPNNIFDLITVGQAIHWFDFDSFYQQVNRVAGKDALLAVIGYGMIRINKEINPIVDRLYDQAFDRYFTEAREYLDNHYKTLPFPFEEIPSPSFNRTLKWSVDDLEGYFNSWSAIQKIKTEQHSNPATKTMEKIRGIMPENRRFEVTFPIFMRLGIVNTK